MQNTRTLRQFLFFLFVRPMFPFLQWVGRASGLFVRAKTVEGPHLRQPYLLGQLQNDTPPEALQEHLEKEGFCVERIAYTDPGQILSMRRLCDAYKDRQYHVRVFDDGEVRGHYEYTPEDRPWSHMQEALFEPKTEVFRTWLKAFVSPPP